MNNFLPIILMVLLSGCGMIGSGDGTGETNIYDAEIARAEARAEVLKSYFGAMEARFASSSSPTVEVTTTIGDDGRPVYSLRVNVADAITASMPISDAFGVDLNTGNGPLESGFSQGAKAVGGVINEALRAPAILGASISYALLGAIDAIAGEPKIRGEYVTINESFNESKVSTGGDGDVIGTGPGDGEVRWPEAMPVDDEE